MIMQSLTIFFTNVNKSFHKLMKQIPLRLINLELSVVKYSTVAE